jgi:carbonic anhydrase
MSADALKQTYDAVFARNKAWAAEKAASNADFFANLAKGQDPEFLFIGCADSRVPVAQVMGQGPGDVFVHRNVANLVLHTDMNIQSVIEYAVAHLGVRHIVVCGHSNCGGVKAAMTAADLGALNPWLREIRDVYAKHQEELEALDEHDRYVRLIERNVEEQCRNVIATSSVQAKWAKGDVPQVHGWVFHLETGLLQDLELDWSGERAAMQRVYDLTGGNA